MSLHVKLTITRFNSARTNADKHMHSESMIIKHVPIVTSKRGEHVHLCLTIPHIKLVSLTNMFSSRTPSGRAKAFTALVFCVMMKCDMVSHSSALDSLLHSGIRTHDSRLLHQPITIFITNETTAMTTERVLRPKDFLRL